MCGHNDRLSAGPVDSDEGVVWSSSTAWALVCLALVDQSRRCCEPLQKITCWAILGGIVD